MPYQLYRRAAQHVGYLQQALNGYFGMPKLYLAERVLRNIQPVSHVFLCVIFILSLSPDVCSYGY